MERSGNDLIVQFNQGDNKAFTTIYEENYPTVYYFVRQFVPEREDAEDITAEIFVKLWKKRAGLDSIKNIQAFLYVTARNACIDFLRYTKRQHENREKLLQQLEEQPAEGNMRDDIRAEVLQSIYREMENLPKSCRTVFSMSYLEGLSANEIANKLKINPQSVYNLRQQAIKLLRIAFLDKKMFVALLFPLYSMALRLQ